MKRMVSSEPVKSGRMFMNILQFMTPVRVEKSDPHGGSGRPSRGSRMAIVTMGIGGLSIHILPKMIGPSGFESVLGK